MIAERPRESDIDYESHEQETEVPQVRVDGEHVGGDEFRAIDRPQRFERRRDVRCGEHVGEEVAERAEEKRRRTMRSSLVAA